jgi:RNA polymerase primary sigma factor
MEPVEDIHLSLDEIGVALKRLTSESQNKSQSVEDFHSRISTIFPQISYEPAESLWDDEPEIDDTFMPLWWDELDEPYVLDEYHWLIQIQKMELLNPEETVDLMNAVEAGVLAEAVLEGDMYPELLKKHGKEKFKQIVQNGKRANDEMVLRNLKLVLYIARKYARKVAIEDAFSFGVFGLIQAVKKFDWRLGNQFSTYATWWLRQSITREVADTNTTIDIPVHAVERVNTYNRELREYLENEFTIAGEVTTKSKSGELKKVNPSLPVSKFEPELDSTLIFALAASALSYDFWDIYVEAPWLLEKYESPDLSVADFEYSGIAKDLTTRLTDFVLSQRELEVLLSRHGVLNGEPQTLEEIGSRLGFTRERSRQIEKKAILKLSIFLKGVTINNYWEKIEEASEIYEEKIEKDVSLKLPTLTRDECGSESGYRQHRMKHEEPCRACKRAHRDFKRVYEGGRPKPEKKSPARIKSEELLSTANKDRSMKAASSQVIQVRWALEKLESFTVSDSVLLSAQARLTYPEASLSELAGYLGAAVTKDAVAGNLRRLLKLAERHSGEQPPVGA